MTIILVSPTVINRRESDQMIDIAEGGIISLAEAAALIPSFRSGKPTCRKTLYHWAKHGVRGVRLETAKLGGRTVTSKPALQAFMERLSAGLSDAPLSTPHPLPGATSAPSVATPAPTPAARRRAAEKADRELAALGF